MNKKQWLNSLPEKYKLSSNDKVEALIDNAKNKVYFGQRQIGKTHMSMLDLAYYLKTNSNKNIGFVSPNESITRANFYSLTEMLRDLMGDDIERTARNPYTIRMKDGSTIYFLNGRSQTRGHRFHAVFIDNLDYITNEQFDTILIATAIYKDSFIIANQTSTENIEKAMSIIGGNK